MYLLSGKSKTEKLNNNGKIREENFQIQLEGQGKNSEKSANERHEMRYPDPASPIKALLGLNTQRTKDTTTEFLGNTCSVYHETKTPNTKRQSLEWRMLYKISE